MASNQVIVRRPVAKHVTVERWRVRYLAEAPEGAFEVREVEIVCKVGDGLKSLRELGIDPDDFGSFERTLLDTYREPLRSEVAIYHQPAIV